MSGTNGRLRDVHNPQPSAAAEITPIAANTACAPVSHAVESGGPAVGAASLFNLRHHARDQHHQRRPHRKRVVLLVGRDRKEQQCPRREQAQQPDGARAELHAQHMAGHVFAHGVVQVEVHRVAGVVTQVLEPVAPRLPCHSHRGRQKQAPRENPHQVRQPVPARPASCCSRADSAG